MLLRDGEVGMGGGVEWVCPPLTCGVPDLTEKQKKCLFFFFYNSTWQVCFHLKSVTKPILIFVENELYLKILF